MLTARNLLSRHDTVKKSILTIHLHSLDHQEFQMFLAFYVKLV